MMRTNSTPVRTCNNYLVNDFQIDEDLVVTILPDITNLSIVGERDNMKLESYANFELKRPMNCLLDKQAKMLGNINLSFEITKNLTTPLIIDLSNNEQIASNIKIDVLENITAKVILKLQSKKLTYNNSRIQLNLKENSQLDIALVYDLNACNLVSIEGNFDENAKINFNLFDFCNNISAYNLYFNLFGDNSKSSIKTIYIGEDSAKIDINYLNELYGKKTNAEIEVVGALNGSSEKSFKGTIDFKKGCQKSYGSETEFCTLLSKDAKSKALPMLLCTEEDVDGKHSTATGQIDDKQMFYLMSRGLNQKEAQKLILKTKFNTIINSLFDDKLKEIILDTIDRKFE